MTRVRRPQVVWRLRPHLIGGAVPWGGAMVLLVPGRGCVSLLRERCWFVEKKQEVRTLMTVMVTGAARIQEFIVSTPVVSG